MENENTQYVLTGTIIDINKGMQVVSRALCYEDIFLAKQELVYMFVKMLEGSTGIDISNDIFTKEMLENHAIDNTTLTTDENTDALIEKLFEYTQENNVKLETKKTEVAEKGQTVWFERFADAEEDSNQLECFRFTIVDNSLENFGRSYMLTLLECSVLRDSDEELLKNMPIEIK